MMPAVTGQHVQHPPTRAQDQHLPETLLAEMEEHHLQLIYPEGRLQVDRNKLTFIKRPVPEH